MNNFERITETPEALGAFLVSLPVADGPWDTEFRRIFCNVCQAQNCDGENCPHNAERNNPLWWLKQEGEETGMDETRVYRAALALWGSDAQTLMVFEEMAELQKELCKCARGKDNREAIAEEIADVEIMLGQMKILHDCTEAAAEYRESKLRRLAIRCGLDMDGEPEPVKLGPGVSFRLEKTSVSGPCSPPQAEYTEAMIKRYISEQFKAWAEAAIDGGCIVITPEEAAEIEQAAQEAGPGMIVNLAEGETPPGAWELLRGILAGKWKAPEGCAFNVTVDITGKPLDVDPEPQLGTERVMEIKMPGGEAVKLNSAAEAYRMAGCIQEMAGRVWPEVSPQEAP